MNIDQTVKHIADAQIRSVIDLSNATGRQQGVIKVNHNTFNVRVGENGKVDVSFRGGWFNFWRKESLNRMRAAMQTQYDQFRSTYDATVTRPDEVDTIEDQFSPAIKTARSKTDAVLENRFGADAGRQEIVLYGFGDVRDMVADKLEQHNVNFTSIDYYNTQFGIDPKTLTFDNLPGILDGIKSGAQRKGQRGGTQAAHARRSCLCRLQGGRSRLPRRSTESRHHRHAQHVLPPDEQAGA